VRFPHSEPEHIGVKLRTLRERRGLTLRELAAALGYVSHSYINLVELGKKQPTVELVMKAAAFFQVTPDVLLLDHVDLPGAEAAPETGEAGPG